MSPFTYRANSAPVLQEHTWKLATLAAAQLYNSSETVYASCSCALSGEHTHTHRGEMWINSSRLISSLQQFSWKGNRFFFFSSFIFTNLKTGRHLHGYSSLSVLYLQPFDAKPFKHWKHLWCFLLTFSQAPHKQGWFTYGRSVDT